jgi:hypothetical protein
VQQNKDGVQKWFKPFGHFNFLILFITLSLGAQSFEDFQKVQHIEFQSYKDANDEAFSKYLKEPWEEYKTKISPALYKEQKTKTITPAVQKHISSVGPLVQIVSPKLKDMNLTKPPISSEKKDVNILFFGQKIGFDIDPQLKNAKYYPQNQSGITNFFNTIAASEYEELVTKIEKLSLRFELNDWGVYQLVKILSEALYENSDDRKLFSWFLFNKLGYEVKAGLANKHIVVMYSSQKVIYSTPRFTFDSKDFYVISSYAKGFSEKVFTYKQSYPNATKPFDLSLKKFPHWKQDLRKKELSFKQFNKKYTIDYTYDKNIIDFMATYPQADYETYFNAPMSERSYDEIASNIKKYIDGKKSSVAINFVLNFVQKAFVYERDQEQFGREKVMFADETLYYAKSDCEDRAILFTHLVKKLFGITVIGVKYKDHMATALYIPMRGDSVKAGLRRFVIADPTYINANIGESMPKYRSKIPESFIVVSRDDNG